jgi:CubicO group peptidase (beta-lactamase class C family)
VLHAKYAVWICGLPSGSTVDIAQSVEAFGSRLAIDRRRAAAIRSWTCWTGTRSAYVDGYPHNEEVVRYLIAGLVHAPVAVDAFIESEMRDAGIPGVALAIVEGDRAVQLRGFGVADSSGRTVTPRSRCHCCGRSASC